MSEHSPEPWTSDVSDGFASIRSDGGPNIVAGDGWYDCEDERWEARIREDYRRIVACVNACRGIPTNFLESHAFDWTTIEGHPKEDGITMLARVRKIDA